MALESDQRPEDAQRLFGQRINDGDTYYKRQTGPAFDDVLKLSRQSMAKLIYCLTQYNPRFDRMAKRLWEAEYRRTPAVE